jgi:VWFA-related protein
MQLTKLTSTAMIPMAAAALIAAPAAMTMAQASAWPVPTFHVSSRIVLLDVMVTDAKTGTAVGPLSAKDFVLRENGLPQRIQSFTRDESPLSILFMFDLSASVWPVLHILGGAAGDVLQSLRPDDEVAVMVFSSTAREIQPFTTDRKMAAAAIQRASRMKSGDPTFLNESIYNAALEASASHNPENRRVILCLTDGTTNIPSPLARRLEARSLQRSVLHTEKDAMEELFAAGASFNAVIERSPLSYTYFVNKYAGPVWALEARAYPPGDDHKYAAETGGLVLTTSKKQIVGKLKTMLTDLRSRYTLSCGPSQEAANGTFRLIDVSLTPEAQSRLGKVKVEARRGYIR